MEEYVAVVTLTNDDGFRPTPPSQHRISHHNDHMIFLNSTNQGHLTSSQSMPVFPTSGNTGTTIASDSISLGPLDGCTAHVNTFLIGDTPILHKMDSSHTIVCPGFLPHESNMHSTIVPLLQHPSALLTTPNHGITPDVYVSHIFQYCLGYTPMHRSSLELLHNSHPLPSSSGNSNPSHATNLTSSFFSSVSESQMLQYCTDIVGATRNGNLPLIRSLFSSGQCLNCCNSFGESLLHMACRRGYTDVVRFFIEEAHVSPRRTDDGGRTPLHDALWHRDPQFDIVHTLILHEPALLLCKDKRGFAPFTYSRAEHASLWIQFLWDRRDDIKVALERTEIEKTCVVNGHEHYGLKPIRYKDIIGTYFHQNGV